MNLYTRGANFSWFVFAALLLVVLIFTLFAIKYWKTRMSKILVVTIPLVVFGVLSFLVFGFLTEPAQYLVEFCAWVLILVFLFNMRIDEALFAATSFVIHVICTKGIGVGLVSLLIKKNMYQVLLLDTTNQIASLLAYGLMAAIFIIYLIFVRQRRFETFFQNRGQMQFVTMCHVVLALFMLFTSYNFYYNLDLVWFSGAQILTGVLILVIYWVILNYGMRIAYLLQYDIRNRRQETTLDQQSAHYQERKQLMSALNHFRTRYRELMTTLEYLAEKGDAEKAIGIMRKNQDLLKEIPSLQQFSNNEVIDALLNDTRELAESKGIKFDAQLYYPDNLGVTEREMHQILTNIMENCIEACERIPEGRDRFIRLRSNLRNNWLSVQVQNSFGNAIHMSDGKPVSTKSNIAFEGMGLRYVESVLAERGDMIQYLVDDKQRIFTTTLLLQQKS